MLIFTKSVTLKTWVLLDVVTKVNLSICVECHEAEHKDIVAVQSLNSFGVLYMAEVSDFLCCFFFIVF